MLRQVEVNGRIERGELSPNDLDEFQNAMELGRRTGVALGETLASVPNDDELYDRMTASADRLREEIEKQIKVVEAIVAKQSAEVKERPLALFDTRGASCVPVTPRFASRMILCHLRVNRRDFRFSRPCAKTPS